MNKNIWKLLENIEDDFEPANKETSIKSFKKKSPADFAPMVAKAAKEDGWYLPYDEIVTKGNLLAAVNFIYNPRKGGEDREISYITLFEIQDDFDTVKEYKFGNGVTRHEINLDGVYKYEYDYNTRVQQDPEERLYKYSAINELIDEIVKDKSLLDKTMNWEDFIIELFKINLYDIFPEELDTILEPYRQFLEEI